MADNVIARETMPTTSNFCYEVDPAGNISTNPQPAVDALDASAFTESLFHNYQFGYEMDLSWKTYKTQEVVISRGVESEEATSSNIGDESCCTTTTSKTPSPLV